MDESGLILFIILTHFGITAKTLLILDLATNQSKPVVDIRLRYSLQPGFNNKQIGVYAVGEVTDYKILLRIWTCYRSYGIWRSLLIVFF